jgi:hypothetical protein
MIDNMRGAPVGGVDNKTNANANTALKVAGNDYFKSYSNRFLAKIKAY